MRTLLLLLAVAIAATSATAQKVAFVNTKYILDQLPEYGTAQKELDRL